jgi:hypothetical protein
MADGTGKSASRARLLIGAGIFIVTLIAGLLYVKWLPYYHKSALALTHHSIGTSIVSGKAASPPIAGLTAAWQYALAYFTAVWQALALALILGATIQVLVPRRWIHRLFSGRDFRSIAIAGALSLGGMM